MFMIHSRNLSFINYQENCSEFQNIFIADMQNEFDDSAFDKSICVALFN